MTQQRKPNTKPKLEAFVVEGVGEKAFWTKIGAAWAHEDGKGFTIKLSALPLSGRLIVREPKAETADQEVGA
jgi:hypothetical protein